MSKTALITSRDPKGLQAVSLFEAAYNKAGLDESQAQRLNERGGELQEGISKLITDLSVSDRYADEEVKSSYGYLSGYKKPKSISEQATIIRQYFPDVGLLYEGYEEDKDLPPNAEGWFAIPRWQRIAPTYGEAVEKVLEVLSKARNGKVYNYREGKLGSQYLRQHERTAQMWERTGLEQYQHGILVIAAQFGFLHRGQSVRRAREVMSANEVGLDSFTIGIMLLTHPERLQHSDDLWIDCPGDEYSPDADGRFEHALYFLFFDGKLFFAHSSLDFAHVFFGSASAFLRE